MTTLRCSGHRIITADCGSSRCTSTRRFMPTIAVQTIGRRQRHVTPAVVCTDFRHLGSSDNTILDPITNQRQKAAAMSNVPYNSGKSDT